METKDYHCLEPVVPVLSQSIPGYSLVLCTIKLCSDIIILPEDTYCGSILLKKELKMFAARVGPEYMSLRTVTTGVLLRVR
jgi:hypothetical protein